MKKQSGFTLMELLAVIAVLALIALITTPIVTSLMAESRKNSFKNSMYGLIKTAENYYADKQLEIDSDKIINFETDSEESIEELKFSGIAPESGILTITADGNIILENVSDGRYFANYNKDNGDTLEINESNGDDEVENSDSTEENE